MLSFSKLRKAIGFFPPRREILLNWKTIFIVVINYRYPHNVQLKFLLYFINFPAQAENAYCSKEKVSVTFGAALYIHVSIFV